MSNLEQYVAGLEGRTVLIRTTHSGVHIGKLKIFDAVTNIIVLETSQRIWSWEGAFTLSAVAVNGIKTGKLSIIVPEILITEVIEIIECTGVATETFKKTSIYLNDL